MKDKLKEYLIDNGDKVVAILDVNSDSEFSITYIIANDEFDVINDINGRYRAIKNETDVEVIGKSALGLKVFALRSCP
jgi:hypothetical protein